MNRRGAALTGTHWGLRKIRPHVGAAPAADPAHKPVLDVGQSKVVRPEVGADPDAMAAMMIAAVDQHAAHAEGAHLMIFCGSRRSWSCRASSMPALQ